MSQSKLRPLRILLYVALAVGWLNNGVHFHERHVAYAKAGLHLKNTLLYVAVESWLLFSELILTVCAVLIIREALT